MVWISVELTTQTVKNQLPCSSHSCDFWLSIVVCWRHQPVDFWVCGPARVWPRMETNRFLLTLNYGLDAMSDVRASTLWMHVQVPFPGLDCKTSSQALLHSRKQNEHIVQMCTVFRWQAHTQCAWRATLRGVLANKEMTSCGGFFISVTYGAITTRGGEARKFLGHACCLLKLKKYDAV
jgi:hypothetical protein